MGDARSVQCCEKHTIILDYVTRALSDFYYALNVNLGRIRVVQWG